MMDESSEAIIFGSRFVLEIVDGGTKLEEVKTRLGVQGYSDKI